jgi:ABC-type glycerol-3-phosphate transport system substrate-binding protein
LDPAEQADFFAAFWDQDVVDGVRLGLPLDRLSQFIFYNQSWARELGFDSPPMTPVDFKTQACAAAAANNDGTGGWIASLDPSTVMSWIMAFGGNGINDSRDGYAFNTPQVEAAFEFIKGIFAGGCAWIAESHIPNVEFATRQGLFYSSSVTGVVDQLAVDREHDNMDDWTVIPYPSSEGEPVIGAFGPSYTILKSSPEQQLAAWAFIKWMSQPENQAQFIEARGSLPVRASVSEYFGEFAVENSQWAAAQDLIRYSQAEPNFGSWSVARWALQDAVLQLISPDFLREDIPLLLEELDAVTSETHLQR